MDALADFALIDISADSVTPDRQTNVDRLNETATEPSNDAHTVLIRDLKAAVDLSLKEFEGRIVAKIATEVNVNQQKRSASQLRSQSSAPEAVGVRPLQSEGPVHENVFCDNCNEVIVGIRFKCGMCKDYDLCERCESQRAHQLRSHLFIKIYEPVTASLNQRPLLPAELGATNSFMNFLGSLGAAGTSEVTLEVAHDGPLEIHELAQANGCQFYLRENGKHLCKDYQVMNRSGRHLHAGEFRLEHVFSTGLFPLEAKLPIPEIPEGDVRIVCIAWQLPHQHLALEDNRPMRQATSVYRIKDRHGRQVGEPITASVVMLPAAAPAVHRQHRPSESREAQTEESALVSCAEDDDSFELIGDDELPSCFLLSPNVSPTPEMRPAEYSEHAENPGEDICVSNSDVSSQLDTEPAPVPVQATVTPPPVPPRAAVATVVACQIEPTHATGQTQFLGYSQPQVQTPSRHSIETQSQDQGHTQSQGQTQTERQEQTQSQGQSPAQIPKSSVILSSQRPTQAIVQLQISSAAQDMAHPSAILAAAYMPKKSQWLPPPPKPFVEITSSSNSSGFRGGAVFCNSFCSPGRAVNSSNSSSAYSSGDAGSSSSNSGDIWGQSGEASERLKLQKLLEMGFYRRDVNVTVLRECKWDFDAALNRLSEMYKDW